MKFVIFSVVIFFICLCWVFYWPTPPYEAHWMDSPNTRDNLFDHPELLVSKRSLTNADLERPVIIAVHGFSACTFEWREFQNYAQENSNVLVSTVLLGGHGRDFQAFKKSSKEDWGKPILDEYNALVGLGFRNISFAGASTGASLVLLSFMDGRFDSMPPRHLFLIDALVIPQNKSLKFAPYVQTWLYKDGLVNKNLDADVDLNLFERNWIQARSYHSLSELALLSSHLKRKLHHGFSIKVPTSVHVFQSEYDRIVDPVSAELIYKGLHHPETSTAAVTLQFVESKRHVFTQLAIYKSPSENEVALQKKTFDFMIQQVSK